MAKGLTGLAHIGVRVSDMQRSLEFYVNDLGMELTNKYERAGGTILAFVQAGTCILELIYSPKVDVKALSAGQVDHVCFECDDIASYMARLEGKVELITPIGEMPDIMGGAKNVFFQGPDGERIELFEFTSKVKRV